MNTNASLLIVGNMEVFVVHKNIKNLHLSLLPPSGSIRVSAPNDTREDVIRSFIATKSSWIKKQQVKFDGQERQTTREYVNGESHYYLGNRYRLEVEYINKKPYIVIKNKKKLVLHAKPNSSLLKRERVLLDWYREELKNTLEPLINKWQKEIGVKANYWGIRRMKTRWGTCNEKSKRLWFNLELIKKPESCIQYVVVHELIHLIERNHNNKFVSLMDKYLPKWRSEKDNLNQFILAHENWQHHNQ